MRRALVWGAGGGVGQALTAELAQNGWQVVALGRHLEKVSETVNLTGALRINTDLVFLSQERND